MFSHAILSLLVIGATSFLAAQEVRPAYRPGDSLVLYGAFGPDRAGTVALFNGVKEPVKLSVVSSNRAEVTVPADAKPGTVELRKGDAPVGNLNIWVYQDEDTVAVALRRFFGNIDDSALEYLMALAALGVLTMSVIEAAKNLLPVRFFFQRSQLRAWLRKHITTDNQVTVTKHITAKKKQVTAKKHVTSNEDMTAEERENERVRAVENVIVNLAADGDTKAFYNAECEEFGKQLAAVAQLVVDFPGRFGELLAVFAANANQDDLKTLSAAAVPAGGKLHSGQQPDPDLPAEGGKAKPEGAVPSRERVLDAKNRVRMQVVQSQIALLTQMKFRWGNGIRVISFLLAFGLAVAASQLRGGDWQLPSVLLTSAIAAFLAPVARDLVVAIEKLRE